LEAIIVANDRNRVRGAVLGLSQDGACTDLFENLSVNSLKGDLSNATTFKPPLFSLVNTFNGIPYDRHRKPVVLFKYFMA
jgi:hypothetical protein